MKNSIETKLAELLTAWRNKIKKWESEYDLGSHGEDEFGTIYHWREQLEECIEEIDALLKTNKEE